MWTLLISISGEPAFTVTAPQFELRQAEAYVQRLYGPEARILGQEYVGDR